MTSNADNENRSARVPPRNYYELLGVHPSASVRDIRQAYRDRSKLYHPDTTELPPETATAKFQEINNAYATLSSPERRVLYDQQIGYSRVPVAPSLPSLHQTEKRRVPKSSSAYLDPTDRPLSAGEIFALFILGFTFVGCLVLAIAIGLTRGESMLEAVNLPTHTPAAIVRPAAKPALSAPGAAPSPAAPTPLQPATPAAKPPPTAIAPTPQERPLLSSPNTLKSTSDPQATADDPTRRQHAVVQPSAPRAGRLAQP